MGTLGLAWRNLVRSLPRRWPIMVILAAAVAVLEVGNTLLENSSDGMRRTYTSSFTGDWTVSARGRESFTLFGSDLPLIGEYYVPPTIPDAEQLLARLRLHGGAVGQVTSGGLLSLDSWSSPSPVFGVDFGQYFSLFSDLKLIKGTLAPGPGKILLNEAQLAAITAALGREPALGESLSLTVFNDSSFTIRPVTLAGVYRYPVRDQALDRIALIDPDTARALNGYVYGSPDGAVAATGVSQDELDSLFSSPEDHVAAASKGLSSREVESQLKDTAARDAQNRTLAGSWNFILIKGQRPSVPAELTVRDWKNSAGGTAMVAWLIQLVFNVGMGFVLVGAAFIGINSLALSVSERTREIGTMRALGAGRARVSGLVAAEVLLTVTGAGLGGVAAGLAVVTVLAAQGIPLLNPYLQALFGTELLRPHATWSGTAGHLVLAAVLGLVSIVQPVRLAVGIRPAQAIARGS